MSRINVVLARLRRKNQKALIAYLTVGFPSLHALPGLVETLAGEGVDLMELGIPFSDPLADGPTIQAASQAALRHGVTTYQVLREVERLRRRGIEVPIVLMTYANPVFHYGIKNFCRDSVSSGVDGVIVPDLPPEEANDLIQAARPLGMDTIFLAAPTSPASRLERIVRSSTGFIYYVSLTGVTGARTYLASDLKGHVAAIKRMTNVPVCVGFGISRPDQVREVARVADGVIVGSALLDRIGRAGKDARYAAGTFIRRLKGACHG